MYLATVVSEISMPEQDRIRLNGKRHISPPRPESRYKQPEELIPIAPLRPGMRLLEHGHLSILRRLTVLAAKWQ
jgi:hypothetical protein